MNRFKLVLRVGGALVAAIGCMCMPALYYDPEHNTSLFNNIVNTGAFTRVAFVAIPVGLVALALSFWLPGDRERL